MPIDPEDPDYTTDRVMEQWYMQDALRDVRGKIDAHRLSKFAAGRLLIEAFAADRALVANHGAAGDGLTDDERYQLVDRLAGEVVK